MPKEFIVALILCLISNVKWTDSATDNQDQCAEIPSTRTKKCPSVTSIDEAEIGRLNFSMPTEKEIANDGNIVGIIPLHYKWLTDFTNETHFEGRTKIFIKAIKETNRIVLNAYKLKIYPNSIYVYRSFSLPDTYICVSKFGYSEKDNFIILDLATSLKPNEMYILDFRKYEGSMGYHDEYDEKTSAGIWRNDFESSTWAVATIFQMRNARKAFPCFDHPSLKATFDTCIIHSSETVAMSNTELEKETKMDDGRLCECFKRTPKVPTYVTTVSLMANFTKLVDTSKHPKMEIIFSSLENEAKYKWQIAEARRILDYFRTELNLQYNLTRLGLLNLSPVQFWGIENFGLVSMESGTPANMDNREELIHRILVHEIVHQWLGNVATISYWDEVCLQEGLTALLEWTITDKLKLANTSFDKKLKDTLRDTWYTGERYLERIADRIIDRFTKTQSIANYCFNRPPIILHMISYSYGKDIWTKFITQLVEKYSYSNANFEDWIALISEVSGTPDAGEVLRSWFSEKGYPILYASMESPTKVKLQQKIVEDYEDPVVPVKGLTIPLKVGSQSLLSNTVLFNAPQQILDINVTIDKWFLVDPDFVTITRKLYAPSNYIGLLDCYYGPNNSSCKLNNYQMEQTFSYLCVALQNDLLPWSWGAINDTNVDDWKNLTAKLRDVVLSRDASYFERCKCAVMLKEDITGSHKECVFNWNMKWMNSKLMKMLGRTYKINKPSTNDKK